MLSRLIALLALLVMPGVLMPEPGPRQDALSLGIFPRRPPANTLKMYTPLAAYLSRQLGREVEIITSPDFAAFWQKVERQEFDIVHYNQYHYVRSHRDFGYRVVARNEEFGKGTIAAAIFVRKDSGIEHISDLKGRKIAFGGGKQAMISHILARHLLQKNGLQDKDYFTQYALNPPKAVIAAYYRQVAAAGAGDVVLGLPQVKKNIDVSDMKMLMVSEQVAHLPWAVSPRVNAELEQEIKTALIGLQDDTDGKQILASARLTNLISARDEDYHVHREVIMSVLGEDYSVKVD